VRATRHDRAHVVGHDWGGVLAWAFAGSHPELVDKLVILNAPHIDIFSLGLRYKLFEPAPPAPLITKG